MPITPSIEPPLKRPRRHLHLRGLIEPLPIAPQPELLPTHLALGHEREGYPFPELCGTVDELGALVLAEDVTRDFPQEGRVHRYTLAHTPDIVWGGRAGMRFADQFQRVQEVLDSMEPTDTALFYEAVHDANWVESEGDFLFAVLPIECEHLY